MYRLTYKAHFDAAHKLNLPYKSKCRNLHGHRFYIEIIIEVKKLNKEGMVIDFSELKSIIDKLDHSYLNELISQPTSENLAKYFYEIIKNKINGKCRVKIWENPHSLVEYYGD